MPSAHPFVAARAESAQCSHVYEDGSVCCRKVGASIHRVGGDRHKGKRDQRGRARGPRGPRKPAPPAPLNGGRPYAFFDTEGKGGGKNHRLIYGAVVDETGALLGELEGVIDSIGRVRQPPPEVWLDFILAMAAKAGGSLFMYGGGYDRTKMLEGLPPEILYMLTRREERPPSATSVTRGKGGKAKKPRPKPLFWRGYTLDLQGTQFKVSKTRRSFDGRIVRSPKTGKPVVDCATVFDIVKFFQCGFGDAIDQWRYKPEHGENLDSTLVVPDWVYDEEGKAVGGLEHMRMMKSKRAEFDKMPWDEVKRYCQDECRYGALLVRQLVTACEAIGVRLRRFDGAGSISDALMTNHEVNLFMSESNVVCRWVRDSVLSRKLGNVVLAAFAGGRFETSHCGVVDEPVYEKDIASAYPYAMAQLPCLACGRWEHIAEPARRRGGAGIDRQIETASLALLRVRVRGRDKNQAFGSLFHRDAKGRVRFPLDVESWCWHPEYLAARDDIKDRCDVLEAFLYRTDCDHRPFAFVPSLYLQRLLVGKEGRGIAMKLGYNGMAGKTMQRVGAHRWQEYIWAGMTTSTTRAQLLTALSLFKDMWDVRYIATDSVFATSDPTFPDPIVTGTGEAVQRALGVKPDKHGNMKPSLGAWERSEPFDKGMVFVRPGIAFPLDVVGASEDDLRKISKRIKARGIAKSVLLKEVDRVVDAMRALDRGVTMNADAPIPFTRRVFGGMKMCTSKSGTGALTTYRAARPRYKTEGGKHAIVGGYGCWFEQPMNLSLDPHPKRLARLPDGMLLPWPDADGFGPSRAYGDKRSPEAIALAEAQDEMLEQPDTGALDSGDGAEAE